MMGTERQPPSRTCRWCPASLSFKLSPIRGVWVAACACLLVILAFNPFGSSTESLLVPLIALVALTAPLGWLGMYLVAELSWVLWSDVEPTSSRSQLRLILQTVIAIAIGYWQWFVLIPHLWRLWQQRSEKNTFQGREPE